MRGRGVISQWQHTVTACQSRHGLWGLRHQIEGCQRLLHIVRQRARCRQLVNGAHADSLSVRSCAANFHPIMKALQDIRFKEFVFLTLYLGEDGGEGHDGAGKADGARLLLARRGRRVERQQLLGGIILLARRASVIKQR